MVHGRAFFCFFVLDSWESFLQSHGLHALPCMYGSFGEFESASRAGVVSMFKITSTHLPSIKGTGSRKMGAPSYTC